MKKIIFILICLCLVPQEIHAGQKPLLQPFVKAVLLADMKTGRVLYQQNADRIMQPASLAKIMSLYLISEDIEMKKGGYSDLVTISPAAVAAGGSKMLFKANERYEVFDLMKGMAIHSANDAAVALAEHFGGSQEAFVRRMNAKAKQLGMKNTHFVNPHGLPDKKQKSTAKDIYILSREYFRRFPNSCKIHSIERFAVNDMILTNRNDLLQTYSGADGLKTGYVYASGFHVVATAVRGDMRLIAVVMGAKDRNIRLRQTRMLLDYGFSKTGA